MARAISKIAFSKKSVFAIRANRFRRNLIIVLIKLVSINFFFLLSFFSCLVKLIIPLPSITTNGAIERPKWGVFVLTIKELIWTTTKKKIFKYIQLQSDIIQRIASAQLKGVAAVSLWSVLVAMYLLGWVVCVGQYVSTKIIRQYLSFDLCDAKPSNAKISAIKNSQNQNIYYSVVFFSLCWW